eukprot:1340619-Amphidinium_carterae.4
MDQQREGVTSPFMIGLGRLSRKPWHARRLKQHLAVHVKECPLTLKDVQTCVLKHLVRPRVVKTPLSSAIAMGCHPSTSPHMA